MRRRTDEAVSVVIPCFNSAPWIAHCLDSVLQQTVPLEIIVVDDGSTDQTLNVLRRFGDHLRLFHNPYIGASYARNLGLREARNPYIIFLDADDYLEHGFLEGQLSTASAENADLVIGRCADAFHDGRPPRDRRQPSHLNERELVIDWLGGQCLPPCALLWRTQFVRSIGGWNSSLLRNQDGDLLYRAALYHPKLAQGQHGRAMYRHHQTPGRTSNNSSRRYIADSFDVMHTLWTDAADDWRCDPRFRRAMSQGTHLTERHAVFFDHRDLAATIGDFRRSCGFPRIDGKASHRVSASVLGLRNKDKLAWGQWARLKAAVRRQLHRRSKTKRDEPGYKAKRDATGPTAAPQLNGRPNAKLAAPQ